VKEKETILFKYVYDPHYAIKYVNGVYGGVTPYLEIVVHFYLERQDLPVSETRELARGGELGPILDKDPEAVVWARQVGAGIVLTLDNARAIRDWLSTQIKSLEAMVEGKIQDYDDLTPQ
jgi:hypothetical protein